MALARSDRALRRIVSQLAALHEADVDAILGELTDSHRRAIEGLLSEARGDIAPDDPSFDPPASEQRLALQGLSPWLAARAELALGHGEPGQGPPIAAVEPGIKAMTPTVRRALAAAVLSGSESSRAPPAATPTTGWFSRFLRPSVGKGVSQ
jgi:hypothetical protein